MKYAALLLLCITSATLRGQHNGIRFIMPEAMFGESGPEAFSFIGLGVGYDHTFNDRMSMGFDVIFPYILGKNDADGELNMGDWNAFYYIQREKSFSVSYRTSCFFNSRNRGAYIGSSIGMVKRSETYGLGFAMNSVTYEYGVGPFPQDMSISQMVFPVGIRLGLKAALGKGYLDFYGGAAYQIGNGSVEYTNDDGLLQDHGITTTPLMFSVGVALGAYAF